MRLFDLTGSVAIVTGGNGGIGLGMAKGLAEAGADIVVAARNRDKSERACEAIQAFGRKAEFVQFDASSETSCHSIIAEAYNKFGRLDILVNNAGLSIRGRPEEISIADVGSVLNGTLLPHFAVRGPPTHI